MPAKKEFRLPDDPASVPFAEALKLLPAFLDAKGCPCKDHAKIARKIRLDPDYYGKFVRDELHKNLIVLERLIKLFEPYPEVVAFLKGSYYGMKSDPVRVSSLFENESARDLDFAVSFLTEAHDRIGKAIESLKIQRACADGLQTLQTIQAHIWDQYSESRRVMWLADEVIARVIQAYLDFNKDDVLTISGQVQDKRPGSHVSPQLRLQLLTCRHLAEGKSGRERVYELYHGLYGVNEECEFTSIPVYRYEVWKKIVLALCNFQDDLDLDTLRRARQEIESERKRANNALSKRYETLLLTIESHVGDAEKALQAIRALYGEKRSSYTKAHLWTSEVTALLRLNSDEGKQLMVTYMRHASKMSWETMSHSLLYAGVGYGRARQRGSKYWPNVRPEFENYTFHEWLMEFTEAGAEVKRRSEMD